MPRIVIAAGGTAGHVVPALAVADELRASGADVSFVGTRERVEAELVPAAGYELHHISALALDRANPLKAALAAARAAGAVAASARLLRRLRPAAVLAAGGYVAGPVGLAAALTRTPLVLSESDSLLGLSNRLLAPFARRVCLAFPIEGRVGERYVVTGRPVPRAVVEADRESARRRLGIEPDAFCLFVFGGSLGARSINDAALAAFAGDETPEVTVVHVAGRRDHAELQERLERHGRPARYRLFEYLPDLADPLAASDLVLARAGGSVFELAAAGKAAVLVPYPRASAGHQDRNAHWMAGAGAAVVLPDSELEPARLREIVGGLAHDRERLAGMAAAARSLARPDAARRVADELLRAAARQIELPEPAAVTAPAASNGPLDLPWRGRRLHFVGVGGAGMSGLALVAQALGAEVSGCDRAESGYTRMLRDHGIEPAIGHSPDHVAGGVELVVSTAVPSDSPELLAARELGAPVIHRGRLLAELASLRSLIAIAGTHGKTTTAAMTAHALTGAGLDPGFLVGAELRAGGATAANASWGSGPWLVAEADESDRSFLELAPEIAVVTNVELDHHSTYRSLIELEQAFRSFLERLPEGGAAVVWNRRELVELVPPGRGVRAFAIEGEDGPGSAHLSARSLREGGGRSSFALVRGEEHVCEVELPVPGRHNVLNALAALCACELAGAELERAAASLVSFRPAARRFEPKGEVAGVRVFDDYAHHPSEIAATLAAARALEPRRLVAVFQPHLYSRTLFLHRELGRELARADVAVVLDVYAAREVAEGELAGVSGKLVADACADYAGGRPVWWLPTLDEAQAMLVSQVREGDLVVTLGAGDVDLIAERLPSALAARAQGREAVMA